MFSVNVFGIAAVTKVMLPHLRKAKVLFLHGKTVLFACRSPCFFDLYCVYYRALHPHTRSHICTRACTYAHMHANACGHGCMRTHMRAHSQGRIVNVASIAGRVGIPASAAYSSSKCVLCIACARAFALAFARVFRRGLATLQRLGGGRQERGGEGWRGVERGWRARFSVDKSGIAPDVWPQR